MRACLSAFPIRRINSNPMTLVSVTLVMVTPDDVHPEEAESFAGRTPDEDLCIRRWRRTYQPEQLC